ncbi:MAG: transglutaminase family protein [Proteobacteria bacterium]|nr:MAG: transglutaminase family protein [Pseudomonadota bacterium]
MSREHTDRIDQPLAEYLEPARFIDSDNPAVREFAGRVSDGAAGDLDAAVRTYYAVRDEIYYDPFLVGPDPGYFRASDCLRLRRGFCIPKAALLAACARALGIPARVGYADVRNHLSTPRLTALVGGNEYTWHSYTDLYLEGRWVKATPAFNLALCERFGVQALEFDGGADSLFQEFNRKGERHMQYLRYRGT